MSFAAQVRERSRPVLPLAPMVDVLFLLLIFFMTASVFREQELQIDVALPTAEMAQPPATTATQITISLTADDRIYLGPRELTLAALRRRHGTSLLKAALEHMGLAGGPCRAGQRRVGEADRQQLEELLPAFAVPA